MNCNPTMQDAVQRYLQERRRLGFALKSPGTELMRFARFADARGHQGPLTIDLQLDWAREHVARTGPVTAARRLEIVRPFAAHYRQFEPATEVAPPFILGHGHRRLAPHIYTDEEIAALLEACARMVPQDGLRPWTYKTLFGLIAATGLRVSEALKLQIADLDLPGATLTVRQTKFYKSRCLPLHASVVQALSDYLNARQRLVMPTTRPSLSPKQEARCRAAASITCLPGCAISWGGVLAVGMPGRASMTCATRWWFGVFSNGMRTACRSTMRCSGYALTWATRRSRTRTGTSPAHQS